jgi:hypothetical protein
MNSVEDSIAQSIVYLDNAINVWNELKERFSRGDYIRISELQVEIYGLKQGTHSVSEYFTVFKTLWEELEAYCPMPVCNCPHKCVCVCNWYEECTTATRIESNNSFSYWLE